MIKIIIAVVIAAVVGIAIFSAVDNVTPTGEGGGSEPVSETYTVSIAGEVNKVGTYYIAVNSTLGDLINAAGGTTSNADERSYNLDYVLAKNQSFYIAPLYRNSETCSKEPIEKVNINTATAEEIMAAKNFTLEQNKANNIVAYRESKGAFARIEDLMEVSYIGTATFEKMKDTVVETVDDINGDLKPKTILND